MDRSRGMVQRPGEFAAVGFSTVSYPVYISDGEGLLVCLNERGDIIAGLGSYAQLVERVTALPVKWQRQLAWALLLRTFD